MFEYMLTYREINQRFKISNIYIYICDILYKR